MIRRIQVHWHNTSALLSWRSGLVLVLLAEIVILRMNSQGRFALLSQGGDAVLGLFYFHNMSKITLFAVSALLIGSLLEGRLAGPSLMAVRWRWHLCILHAGALLALLALLRMLPLGYDESMLLNLNRPSYVAASSAFLIWQLTAFVLLVPRMILREMGWRSLAFVLCAMAAATIMWSGQSWLGLALRAMVEDTTLTLALGFYAVLSDAAPVLSFIEGTPMLRVGDFEILIAPSCAGYHGVLASSTIMAGLLIVEWPQLRQGPALMLGLAAVAGVFILNALRIALLVYIGANYSPAMAVDGFHSNFGTLSLLVVVALALLALQHPRCRGTAMNASAGTPTTVTVDAGSAETQAAYLVAPLALYLSFNMVLGLFIAGFNWTYPLLAAVGFVLIVLWRRPIAQEFHGGTGFWGVVVGIAVYLLWLAMVPADPEMDFTLGMELNAASLPVMIGWIICRVIGFGLIVPILEELAFRGGLQRLISDKLTPWTASYGAALIAWLLSALAFGAMHSNMLAGTLAGLCFGLLVLQGKRIGVAIVAHAVTNLMLAVTAIVTGSWSLL